MGIEVVRGNYIRAKRLSIRVSADLAGEYPLNQGATLTEQVASMLRDVGLSVKGIESTQMIPLVDELSGDQAELRLWGEKVVRPTISAD